MNHQNEDVKSRIARLENYLTDPSEQDPTKPSMIEYAYWSGQEHAEEWLEENAHLLMSAVAQIHRNPQSRIEPKDLAMVMEPDAPYEWAMRWLGIDLEDDSDEMSPMEMAAHAFGFTERVDEASAILN